MRGAVDGISERDTAACNAGAERVRVRLLWVLATALVVLLMPAVSATARTISDVYCAGEGPLAKPRRCEF